MLRIGKLQRFFDQKLYSLAVRSIINETSSISHCSRSHFSQNVRQNIIPSRKEVKLIQNEYKAALNLMRRSFGTSSAFSKDSKPNPNASSSGGDNSNKNDDDDKKKNNEEDKMMALLMKGIMWLLTIYFVVTFAGMILQNRSKPEQTTRYVSWHEFVHHMLAAGEIKELIIRPDMEMVTIILHDGAIIRGKRVLTNVFHMAIVDTEKFEAKLRDVEKRLGVKDGVPISYNRSTDVVGRLISTLIVAAIALALLSRMKGGKSPISMDSFSQMGRAKFTLIDPVGEGKGVLFKDVAGLHEVKQEVTEFVDYLKNPEKYQRLGAKVPKGALLLGPPGCGKTLLAKAVATESQVPFLSMNGSEFIEMIGGLGAARVRDLFKEAKTRSPCIIYIDEIDAIGRQRAGTQNQMSSGGESEQTLNQLLVELDGMASKEGVLMLASTNRADILDKALLRPGRFDRHIVIDLPNLAERKEIFEKHLSGIKLAIANVEKYSARLATLTPGFSGADIANVCNESALHAARTSQKFVNEKNLEYAVERLVGGTEKRSHALSLVERRVIAFHESGHALVGWLLPNSDVLLKVTIVPRTSLALGFAQYTPAEQKLFSKEQLFDKMCMALGGRVAENLIFNRITTGAQNDLEKVTKMAYAQIKHFGMNDRIGPMYIADDNEEGSGSEKPYSKFLGTMIDEEVRHLVARAYKNTEEILLANKDKLTKMAETLLDRETLNYDDVVELIGPPPFESAKRKIEPVEFEDNLNKMGGQ